MFCAYRKKKQFFASANEKKLQSEKISSCVKELELPKEAKKKKKNVSLAMNFNFIYIFLFKVNQGDFSAFCGCSFFIPARWQYHSNGWRNVAVQQKLCFNQKINMITFHVASFHRAWTKEKYNLDVVDNFLCHFF